MVGYNKNIRPMEHYGDITDVKIKMTLTNLISLVKLCLCLHKVNICVNIGDTMVYHLFSCSEWERGDPHHLRLDWDGKTNHICVYVQYIVISEQNLFLSLSVKQWRDYRLRWANRTGFEAYENITRMRLPSKAIWLPDVGLENKWVAELLKIVLIAQIIQQADTQNVTKSLIKVKTIIIMIIISLYL